MTRSLWLLMRLQTRGWMRSLGRKLRTPKGAMLALVGFAVIGLWLWAVTAAPRSEAGADPESLRRHGPAFFLAYCVLTVAMSRGERGIYFSPAEVNFLFAGPFTRRQLLVYKITVNALIGLTTSLFLTLLLRIHAQWAVAAWAGLFLAFLFLQLFTMAVGLIAITIGTRAYTRGRKLVLLAIGVTVAVLLFRASKEAGGGFAVMFQQLEDSPAWQTLTAPLGWYIETFLVAPGDWLGLAKWGGLSVAVTFVFVLVVLLLDAQYLESAAATSERVYSQIQKMRRGEAVSLHWRDSEKAAWGLPELPYWGGAGPMVWRQATTAIRSLGRLALLVLVFAPVMIGPMFARSQGGDAQSAFTLVASLLAWLSMLMTTLVPFDFRGDLDRMEVLKMLPVRPWRMALGQLLTPILILYVIQAVCLIAFGVLLNLDGEAVLAGLAFAMPINLLLFGLDNLLFLWFPSRIFAANPGDFTALGRNVIILMAKMVVLGAAGAAAGGLGLLVWWLTGYHLPIGLAVGWVVLSLFALAMIPLVGMAFGNFDVSRDLPA